MYVCQLWACEGVCDGLEDDLACISFHACVNAYVSSASQE